jgi:hypothetical protein
MSQPEPLVGKVVIDTNNYYPQRDGHIAALDGWQLDQLGAASGAADRGACGKSVQPHLRTPDHQRRHAAAYREPTSPGDRWG